MTVQNKGLDFKISREIKEESKMSNLVTQSPYCELLTSKAMEILQDMQNKNEPIFDVSGGMPLSIFQDKYARKRANGSFESWSEVIRRVLVGNHLMHPPRDKNELHDFAQAMRLGYMGAIATSGRHLQQGDETQPEKVIELFSNCTTSIFSFITFELLLNGCGVGSDYSNFTRRVNWDNMPYVRLVLNGGRHNTGEISDGAHPDFARCRQEFGGFFETTYDAQHKYPSDSERVRWFTVKDSREGWAEILMILETAAFHEKHKDKLFIFEFSDVRCEGSPIRGHQNRPASGPIPLMRTIAKVSNIKGIGMRPWKQAMFIDEYDADVVVIGGVRRSSRIATKWYEDDDIFEFIEIKRGGHLKTANDSVLVNNRFYREAKDPRSHAHRVFQAIIACNYFDKTGEPGLINVDMLHTNMENIADVKRNYISPAHKLQVHPRTIDMMNNVLGYVMASNKFTYIVNPCVSIRTWVSTSKGLRKVKDLLDDPTVSLVDAVANRPKYVVDGKVWDGSYFFQTGTKNLYKLETREGYELELTEDHRVLTKTKEHTMVWVEARNLKENDKVIIHNNYSYVSSKMSDYLSEIKENRSELESILGDSLDLTDTIMKTPTLAIVYIEKLFNKYGVFDIQDPNSDISGVSKNPGQENLLCYFEELPDTVAKNLQILLLDFGIDTRRGDDKVVLSYASSSLFIRYFGVLAKNEQALSRFVISDKGGPPAVISSTFKSLTYIGEETVYDVHVPGPFAFFANGIYAHNCAEIPLAVWGGMCIVGDVAMHLAKTLQDILDAIKYMTHMLIRVNMMPGLYQSEIDRTNRIGVSLIGILEAAWKFFKCTFSDLIKVHDLVVPAKSIQNINPEDFSSYGDSFVNAIMFWQFMDLMRSHAEVCAAEYSVRTGRNVPHTVTTLKPGGTVSKVMNNSTESANIPVDMWSIRWVQYEKAVVINGEKITNPVTIDLVNRGYPIQDISHKYTNKVVIGFPTRKPLIETYEQEGATIDVATTITPEQQYNWLRLLEKTWLGYDEDGKPKNNNISYTLKFKLENLDYENFRDIVIENQNTIRMCAFDMIKPIGELRDTYGYTPEEPITRERYEELVDTINRIEKEGYDENLVACENGVCPIEANIN